MLCHFPKSLRLISRLMPHFRWMQQETYFLLAELLADTVFSFHRNTHASISWGLLIVNCWSGSYARPLHRCVAAIIALSLALSVTFLSAPSTSLIQLTRHAMIKLWSSWSECSLCINGFQTQGCLMTRQPFSNKLISQTSKLTGWYMNSTA